jgi:membrane protein DedA with SNARE-associated domain
VGDVSQPAAEESQRHHWTLPDILCVAGLAVSAIRVYATIPAIGPLLGTNPVLLELIRGSTSSMVTAGAFARVGRASLPLAVLAGIVGLGFFSVFYWWAGRRFGNRILGFYAKNNPRYARWIERSERFLARWGGLTLIVQYFQPIPNALLYIGTGAAGLPLWQFLVFNTIGCGLWVGLAVGLGYAIGNPAVHVAKQISHYSLYVTFGLIALVILYAFFRASRDQRPDSPGSAETPGKQQREPDSGGRPGDNGAGVVQHPTEHGADA